MYSAVSTLYKSVCKGPGRILPKILEGLVLELFLRIVSKIETEFNQVWTGISGKLGIPDTSIKQGEAAWV